MKSKNNNKFEACVHGESKFSKEKQKDLQIGFLLFDAMSTFVGYLMPKPF